MARKRMIDPAFWTDQKLGECIPMARLTFMGLISQSDDDGRLEGHPALIKSALFPYDYGITPVEVEEWLSILHGKGIIVRYEVSGQNYIQLPNFRKHQTINKPTPSKLPAPTVENAEFSESSLTTTTGLREDYGSTTSQEKRKEVKEKGKEAEGNTAADTKNPFTFYQQNISVSMGAMVQAEMLEWCNEMTDAVVIEAMKRAVAENVLKWSYVEAILKDWMNKGIKTVDAALAEQAEHERRKGLKQSGGKQQQSNGGHSRDDLIRESAKLEW